MTYHCRMIQAQRNNNINMLPTNSISYTTFYTRRLGNNYHRLKAFCLSSAKFNLPYRILLIIYYNIPLLNILIYYIILYLIL